MWNALCTYSIKSFFLFVLPFFLCRNVSSKNTSFVIVPSAVTWRECWVQSGNHRHWDGGKTNSRRIRSEGMCVGDTMCGACNATGSCWHAAWLEWHFEVTKGENILFSSPIQRKQKKKINFTNAIHRAKMFRIQSAQCIVRRTWVTHLLVAFFSIFLRRIWIVKNNLRGIIVSYLIVNWIALIITFVRRVVIVMCERVWAVLGPDKRGTHSHKIMLQSIACINTHSAWCQCTRESRVVWN